MAGLRCGRPTETTIRASTISSTRSGNCSSGAHRGARDSCFRGLGARRLLTSLGFAPPRPATPHTFSFLPPPTQQLLTHSAFCPRPPSNSSHIQLFAPAPPATPHTFTFFPPPPPQLR